MLASLETIDNDSNKDKQITQQDYELFCKEFVFHKLKGKSFGFAFCEKFKFNDIFLKSLSDDTAKNHIEIFGYIKNDTPSN